MNHRVVSLLYKPCSASVYVKTGFIKYYKRYRAPCARRIGKRRRKEEVFIFQNQKSRGNKKMIHEIESLMGVCMLLVRWDTATDNIFNRFIFGIFLYVIIV